MTKETSFQVFPEGCKGDFYSFGREKSSKEQGHSD